MSLYPSAPDVFVNRTGSDVIASSDPNNAYDAIETIQGFVGSIGKSQANSLDIADYLSRPTPPICVKKDANTITVRAGSVIIKNAGFTARMMRRNTSDTDITATDIDTGAMADATYYYIYAVADSAATTFTVKFSLSSTAPTGLTNFELIGWFYNQAGGSLTITDGFVGNMKSSNRDVPNSCRKSISANQSTASSTYGTIPTLVIPFYSSGRPLFVNFNAGLVDYTIGQTPTFFQFRLMVDSTTFGEKYYAIIKDGVAQGDNAELSDIISSVVAGTHNLYVQFASTNNGQTCIVYAGTSPAYVQFYEI